MTYVYVMRCKQHRCHRDMESHLTMGIIRSLCMQGVGCPSFRKADVRSFLSIPCQKEVSSGPRCHIERNWEYKVTNTRLNLNIHDDCS